MSEVSAFESLLTTEKRYFMVFYKLLNFCRSEKTLGEVLSEVANYPEMKNSMYSTTIILKWLENVGAVKSRIDSLDAGEKPLTQEELNKQELWFSTEVGVDYIDRESPENRLKKYIIEDAECVDVIIEILIFCKESKYIPELEAAFDNHPKIRAAKLSPNYFISSLENVGGVVWDDGWRSTEMGLRFAEGIKEIM